jgi:hypothetical protein
VPGVYDNHLNILQNLGLILAGDMRGS